MWEKVFRLKLHGAQDARSVSPQPVELHTGNRLAGHAGVLDVKDYGSDSYNPYSTSSRKKASKVNPDEVKRRLQFEYSYGLKDDTRRYLDALQKLLSHFEKPNVDLRALLREAAEILNRQFKVREVVIGLKSPRDNLFRYEVFAGMRQEAQDALRKITYDEEQFFNDEKFKCTELGKRTRIYLAEDAPYLEGEEEAYNRPVLLKSVSRATPMDAVEGDYIDVLIPGTNGEPIGWIEFTCTVGGKIPDVNTLRWIETIAMILGAAITCGDRKRVVTLPDSSGDRNLQPPVSVNPPAGRP